MTFMYLCIASDIYDAYHQMWMRVGTHRWHSVNTSDVSFIMSHRCSHIVLPLLSAVNTLTLTLTLTQP